MTWFDVEGTVVGYLRQEEEEEQDEYDVMVVQVTRINGELPIRPRFLMRWTGNDYDVIDAPDDAEEGWLIGARIEFTTNAEEQARYASKEG